MKIAFEQRAFADFIAWAEQDRKIHKRIVTLILDIARNPYQGIGKPEPLKHELRGYCGPDASPTNIGWCTRWKPIA